MTSWRAGTSALRSRTGVRRVLVAYAGYSLLEFYAWLVVILWAYAAGGAGLAGAAALVQLLPAAVLAPALASVGDRMPRGRALVLAYVFVAAGAVLTWTALAVSAPAWVVLLAGTALTTAIAAARPVHFAALPALARAEPEQLVSANSLSSVIDGCTRFLGPVLAGLAVAASGPARAMAAGALVALLAPLLCLRLRLPALVDDDADEPEESLLRGALAGLSALRGTPAALLLLLVMSVDFLLTGVIDILGVAFADTALAEGDAAAGFVVGAMGIGALVGAVAGAALAQRRALAIVVVGGVVLEGAMFASAALTARLVGVVLVLAAAGIGGAVTVVAGRTLLQRTTDERVLARVFAVQESTSLLGLALGAVLAPVLIGTLGVRGAWVPLGLGVVLLALACLGLLRSLDSQARWLPLELSLLRAVPFVATLPPYQLEKLAHRVRWRTASAGETVVAQGETGDDMYVVADGELSTWVSGERRPGTLRERQWFGEVAMLRGSERTATVVAETPVRLLVVPRAAFVRAAGGDAESADLAQEAVRAYPDLTR
ncbi:MAG: cyclic nucleotide-binding domain-containing protein [Candidatus Nanopelagicales bacterium]